MKRNEKKGMIIILVILGVILAMFAVWAVMSPGTIRQYEGDKSLSEKFIMDVNGAPNGFFINSKNTDNPVLLFILR